MPPSPPSTSFVFSPRATVPHVLMPPKGSISNRSGYSSAVEPPAFAFLVAVLLVVLFVSCANTDVPRHMDRHRIAELIGFILSRVIILLLQNESCSHNVDMMISSCN